MNRLFSYKSPSTSSDAYKKDCEKFDNDLNEENLELMFRTKGMKIYKKFYEPRLEWFAQQREFVRYVRQQEIYYKTIIQLVNRRKVDRILSDNPPLDSQIFTAEISVVPQSTQKSEISDEDFRAIVSQLEEIC